MPERDERMRVAIDPCVFAHELARPGERPVCCAWRDGSIVPVVTRRILNHTLGLLRSLGLTRELLQRWALWLTHRETAEVLAGGLLSDSIQGAYIDACVRGGASALVTDCPGDFGSAGTAGVRVVGPSEMVKLLGIVQSPMKDRKG